jgi:hypothetical protein
MSEQEFGGNKVTTILASAFGQTVLADGPYTYSIYRLLPGQSDAVNLGSATLFVRELTDGARLEINDGEYELNLNDALQIEGAPCSFKAVNGEALVLVAGTEKAHFNTGLMVTRTGFHYTVAKPWGHELWLSGMAHPGYALKEIFYKQGNRCSLQYHEMKSETNVLFSGTAKLVYKANPNVANLDVLAADLGETEILPITAMSAKPLTLHRVCAVTDITSYEASTPELDDVIRVHDDAGRGQGRIQGEHVRVA